MFNSWTKFVCMDTIVKNHATFEMFMLGSFNVLDTFQFSKNGSTKTSYRDICNNQQSRPHILHSCTGISFNSLHLFVTTDPESYRTCISIGCSAMHWFQCLLLCAIPRTKDSRQMAYVNSLVLLLGIQYTSLPQTSCSLTRNNTCDSCRYQDIHFAFHLEK